MRYAWPLLIVTLLVAAACSGGDDDGDGTASPTATAATSTATAAVSTATGTASSQAAGCKPPRALSAEERQPAEGQGQAQGTVAGIDASSGTVYLDPASGPVSQVRFDAQTRFLFSDGRPASARDLACGGEVAATGEHTIRADILAEVVGIVVAPAKPQAAELCPISADACSFVNRIAQRVLAGDGRAVLSSSKATFYECPGPNGGLGDPFPLCNGARAGEMRAGFPVRRIQSEGSVLTEADAVRLIAEWGGRTEPSLSDDYGDGAARAYSIVCSGVRADEGRRCEDSFSLVFSGLAPASNAGQPPLRTMLIIDVRRTDDGDLRAYGFGTGVLTYGLAYALEGGTGLTFDQDVPAVLAPSPLDGTFVTFFPWDPSALIN